MKSSDKQFKNQLCQVYTNKYKHTYSTERDMFHVSVVHYKASQTIQSIIPSLKYKLDRINPDKNRFPLVKQK